MRRASSYERPDPGRVRRECDLRKSEDPRELSESLGVTTRVMGTFSAVYRRARLVGGYLSSFVSSYSAPQGKESEEGGGMVMKVLKSDRYQNQEIAEEALLNEVQACVQLELASVPRTAIVTKHTTNLSSTAAGYFGRNAIFMADAGPFDMSLFAINPAPGTSRKLGMSMADWTAFAYQGTISIVEMHARGGVTHNDIKPANWVVRRRDDSFKDNMGSCYEFTLVDLGSATFNDDDGNTVMTQWNTKSYMCPLAMRSHTNFVNGVGDGKHNGFLTDMYAFGKTLEEVYGGSVNHLQGRQGNTTQNPDLEELLDHVTTAKLTARWDIEEVAESDFMKAYASEHPHAKDPIITPVSSDFGGAIAGVVGGASTSTDADEAETAIREDSCAGAPIPSSASTSVGGASTSGAEGGRGGPFPNFIAYPGPGGWGPAEPSRAAQFAVAAAVKAAKSNVMVPVIVPASVPPSVPFMGAEGSAASSSATSGHSGMWSASTGMRIDTSTGGTGKDGSEQADTTQTGQTRPSPPLPRRAPGAVESGACMKASSSGAGDGGENGLGLDSDVDLTTGAGSVGSVGAEIPTTSVGRTPPAFSSKQTGESSAGSSEERFSSVPGEGVTTPLAPAEDAAAAQVPAPPATEPHQPASHDENAASGGALGGIELGVSGATAAAAAGSAAQSQPARNNTLPADMSRQGGVAGASAPSESSSLGRGPRGGGAGGTRLRGVLGVMNSGLAAMGATVAWLGRSGVRMMWSHPRGVAPVLAASAANGASATTESSATGLSATSGESKGTRVSGTKKKATPGSGDGEEKGFVPPPRTEPGSSATTGASPGSPASGMKRKVTPRLGGGEEGFVPHNRTKFGSSATTGASQGTRVSGKKKKATPGSRGGEEKGFVPHTRTEPGSSATTGASRGSPASGVKGKVTPTFGHGEEGFVSHTRTKFGSSATTGPSPVTSASGTKRKAAPGSGDIDEGFVPHTRTTPESSATTGAPAETSASGSKRKVALAFGDGEERFVPRTHEKAGSSATTGAPSATLASGMKRKMAPTFGAGEERFAPRTKASVQEQAPAKIESARAAWVDNSSSNTIKRGRDTDEQATAEGRKTVVKRTKHNKSVGNKSATDSPSATACKSGRSRKRTKGDGGDDDDGGESAGGGSAGAWSAPESPASKRIRLTPSGCT